jgi:hypothetical protein
VAEDTVVVVVAVDAVWNRQGCYTQLHHAAHKLGCIATHIDIHLSHVTPYPTRQQQEENIAVGKKRMNWHVICKHEMWLYKPPEIQRST